ncbi:MAG: xanthine dehydrogenase family protein subunit M, partial [Thermomicrobium sp.]|nr:xanthine dehydrogenase family protein subunit M [Thermomicrobium sp.]
MKPPSLSYERPDDLAGAIRALSQHGPEARPLAGGQSLIPMLALRIARPSVLVDLGRIAELQEVTVQDGALVVGAMVRQRRLERDPLVARHLPLLSAATRLVGHPSIRNRGTLGGSVAHADPSAEYPAVALALDAEMVVRGSGGERVVPARDFFLGPFTTALAADELLTAIRFPLPPATSGWAIEEFARRHGDFALAGAVTLLELGADGRCTRAAIALFGVATRPVRATAAEQALLGQPLTANAIREAALLAPAAIDEPLSDVHGAA